MADSDSDLVRQTMALEIEMQALKIGNSILRAELARLEKQLAEAEANRRNKRRASSATSIMVVCALI